MGPKENTYHIDSIHLLYYNYFCSNPFPLFFYCVQTRETHFNTTFLCVRLAVVVVVVTKMFPVRFTGRVFTKVEYWPTSIMIKIRE